MPEMFDNIKINLLFLVPSLWKYVEVKISSLEHDLCPQEQQVSRVVASLKNAEDYEQVLEQTMLHVSAVDFGPDGYSTLATDTWPPMSVQADTTGQILQDDIQYQPQPARVNPHKS
jgi:hypothetical protein